MSINTSAENAIGWITLDWPERRNAIGTQEAAEWIAPSFVDALGLHFLLPFELDG